MIRQDDGRETLVEVELANGGRNRVQVNRQKLVRVRDLLGSVRVTVFSPDDLVLVKGGPADRRRFMDDTLVALATKYDGIRLEIDRIVRQRNTLLKQAAGRLTDEIAVTLDVPRGLPVSINYATSDGTAQAPGDYAAVSGTLIFAPGETSRVFGVPIYDDTQAEGDETVIATLSDASNAAIGGTNPATLIILDDDRAPACDASNNYCEDYDEYLDAYGPLGPNVPYQIYSGCHLLVGHHSS